MQLNKYTITTIILITITMPYYPNPYIGLIEITILIILDITKAIKYRKNGRINK
jgi:hypothetical protein